LEENVHAEERKRRDKDEKRWLEEETKRKRMEEKQRMTSGGFPDMEPSERLEAEMSAMPLDETAMNLLRRLKAPEALQILHQAGITSVGGNLAHYVKLKVRQRLGDPDSEDEPEEVRRRAEQAKKAAKNAANVAAAVEARIQAQAAEAAKKREEAPPAETKESYDPEEAAADEEEESSEDEDFDHLEEEAEKPPELGHVEEEPTPEKEEQIIAWKSQAAAAAEDGDLKTALLRYTDACVGGGATALMLAKRGELLLKLRRPVAAIRDCSHALKLNPDIGKAFRVRGIAYRKLGRWSDAHNDLKEGQRLDYDEGTSAVQKFVAEKVRVAEEKAARASKRKRPANLSSELPSSKKGKA